MKCSTDFCTSEALPKKRRCASCININRLTNNLRQNRENEIHREERNKYLSNWRKIHSSALAVEAKIRFCSPKGRFNLLKGAAKKRGISFDLDLDSFTKFLESNKSCFYCLTELMPEFGSSMDRLDNSKGYMIGNIVACCTDCNRGRGDRYTSEEWKVMIKALSRFRRSREKLIRGKKSYCL